MTELQPGIGKKSDKKAAAIACIRQTAERYPSTFITRREVPSFSGGLYSVGSMANADCLGNGPEGSFRVGRQVCYPVSSLVEWLLGKLEV